MAITTRRPGIAHLAAATAMLLIAAVAPAQAGLRLFGKSDETRMGRDVAHDLEREYGVWDDPGANARLLGIAEKITAVADTRGFKMTWKVLDTEEVNAVAVPGGFMYVTRGLLELDPRPSDDELAFVIGHETGHIARRHSMDQLEKNLGWAVVVGIIAKGSTAQFVGNLAQQLLASGYSRSDEREADDAGFKYMVEAGYDARGSVSFMRRLMAMSHGEPLKIFASHPPSKERLEHMQRKLAALGPAAAYLLDEGNAYGPSDAGVAEIKRVALRADDYGRDLGEPKLDGTRKWPLFEGTPTREALAASKPGKPVVGLRQADAAWSGTGARPDQIWLLADYALFDSPEAAHWALVWAVLSSGKDPDYRPAPTTEVDELWRGKGGQALVFRRGELVVALEGEQVAAQAGRLVAAIARRVPMPVASLDLVGVPNLVTPARMLAGDEYVGVRREVIGLSTDGWRALGVKVTVERDRATLSRGDRSIIVRVNSEKAEANGAEITLKDRPWAVDRRMYIPAGEVGEALALPLIAAPDSALVVALG